MFGPRYGMTQEVWNIWDYYQWSHDHASMIKGCINSQVVGKLNLT